MLAPGVLAVAVGASIFFSVVAAGGDGVVWGL